jgi:isopenicillin N synthase-like dioxygenase
MEYREHMICLAKVIMHILAEGLSYGAEVFDEFMEDPVASVKLLHYPPRPDAGEQLGGTCIFDLCR